MKPFLLQLGLVGLFCMVSQLFARLPQSPDLEKPGSQFIYGGLRAGDTREEMLSKLRKNGFIQIYDERDSGVVKCAIRWNGFRYELISKMVDEKLSLCLIEGNKGWQDFHYHEVVSKEWKNLKERIVKICGNPTESREFPDFFEVPLDDLGGVITDIWKLSDRTLMLSVRKYEAKDCCTDQILEFSCCTLLIKPVQPPYAVAK